LAVKAALEVLPRLLSSEAIPEPGIAGCELIKRWRAAVAEHLAANPFEALTGGTKTALSSLVPIQSDDSVLAYGTTLLAVAARPEGLLCLQLGDGDILVVTDSGEVQRPVASDQRLFANETTSLCSRTAEMDFRSVWLPESVGRPSLVLLTTDGYPNSFRQDAGFLKAASDFYALISEEGAAAVERDLAAWLEDSSNQGSGDDITVALLFLKRLGCKQLA